MGMCSRDLSTAMCCRRLISLTSISHRIDPTVPWAMASSGLPETNPGISMPADCVIWPTFSSTVICFSRARARCSDSGLMGLVCANAAGAAMAKVKADIRTRTDTRFWNMVGNPFKRTAEDRRSTGSLSAFGRAWGGFLLPAFEDGRHARDQPSDLPSAGGRVGGRLGGKTQPGIGEPRAALESEEFLDLFVWNGLQRPADLL